MASGPEWRARPAGMYSDDAGDEAATAWPCAVTRTLRRSTGTPDDRIGVGQAPRVNRTFRLTSATDIKRVRRTGKSYAHPLVLLVASPNGGQASRVGVSASQSVGNAVMRNRAKRRMREALRMHLGNIDPGWDLILVARPGLDQAAWSELVEAVGGLLRRARLANGGSQSDNGSTARE